MLRIATDGGLFIKRLGELESPIPQSPVTLGFKGDSVFATQQHLANCLRTGQLAESEGREYLKTMTLVEESYRIAKNAGAQPFQFASNFDFTEWARGDTAGSFPAFWDRSL